MTADQKQRLKERLKPILIILGIGFLYYIFVCLTDIKIPCIFRMLTGLSCPGCGATRMVMALLRFDFKEAFFYNKVLFVSLPFLIGVFAFENYRYIKNGERKYKRLSTIIIVLSIVALLIYGVLRNI